MSLAPTPPPWWLVVESSPRWSAAVRFELRRLGRVDEANRVGCQPSLVESGAIESIDQPTVVSIEVSRAELTAALGAINSLQANPALAVAALATDGDLEAALLESGAKLVLRSPLEVDRLVRFGDRHAGRCWGSLGDRLDPRALVWRRLPWQSAPWRLG